MFSLPLYIFAILYGIFLLVFVIFCLFNLTHLLTTGSFTAVSLLMTLFVIFLAAGILWFTYLALADVDWQQSVTIFNNAWFGNVFGDKTTL